MNKLLFVDDDIKYQSIIKSLLENEGYEVWCENEVYDALNVYKDNFFDLVITDLMMDRIDGLQFVSLLRKIDPKAKVIILTGSDEDSKEIKALSLRVTDYIKKPVSIDVLLKRVAIVFDVEDDVEVSKKLTSVAENIVVDIRAHKVYKEEEDIELTAKEFDVLCFFLKNKNEVFTREDILKEVWRVNEKYIDSRTVDGHIKKIRNKLRISAIHSIRGVGYQWNES